MTVYGLYPIRYREGIAVCQVIFMSTLNKSDTNSNQRFKHD